MGLFSSLSIEGKDEDSNDCVDEEVIIASLLMSFTLPFDFLFKFLLSPLVSIVPPLLFVARRISLYFFLFP